MTLYLKNTHNDVEIVHRLVEQEKEENRAKNLRFNNRIIVILLVNIKQKNPVLQSDNNDSHLIDQLDDYRSTDYI